MFPRSNGTKSRLGVAPSHSPLYRVRSTQTLPVFWFRGTPAAIADIWVVVPDPFQLASEGYPGLSLFPPDIAPLLNSCWPTNSATHSLATLLEMAGWQICSRSHVPRWHRQRPRLLTRGPRIAGVPPSVLVGFRTPPSLTRLSHKGGPARMAATDKTSLMSIRAAP